MHIKPERLRALRNFAKLSREKLAADASLSPRHLARLESLSEPPKPAREATLAKLADALHVAPGVLSGELPMPAPTPPERPGDGERVQVSAQLWPEVRLAYALIKQRYGISQTTIFNAGPLLFVLLAEGSLAWRREKLAEVREAAQKLHALGQGQLSFACSAYRALEASDDEEESIEQLDLFGGHAAPETYDLGYDPSINNPFADYLREFSRKIGKPEIVDVDGKGLLFESLEGFPSFTICAAELDAITGGSEEAAFALERGYVRVSDIPADLRSTGALEKRVKWLCDKIPEQARKWLEDPNTAFQDLLSEVNDDNAEAE